MTFQSRHREGHRWQLAAGVCATFRAGARAASVPLEVGEGRRGAAAFATAMAEESPAVSTTRLDLASARIQVGYVKFDVGYINASISRPI